MVKVGSKFLENQLQQRNSRCSRVYLVSIPPTKSDVYCNLVGPWVTTRTDTTYCLIEQHFVLVDFYEPKFSVAISREDPCLWSDSVKMCGSKHRSAAADVFWKSYTPLLPCRIRKPAKCCASPPGIGFHLWEMLVGDAKDEEQYKKRGGEFYHGQKRVELGVVLRLL